MNEYFYLFGLLVFSCGLSYLIMHRLAQLTNKYWFYRLVLFPGVVLHETSHAIACMVTGTPIEKISLWTETGGSMTHHKPKYPLITQPIISFAPMIIGLAALFFLSHWFIASPLLGKVVAGILLVSIAATLSPSTVDIVHAIEGLIFILAILAIIAWLKPEWLINFDKTIAGLNWTILTIVVTEMIIFAVVYISHLGLKKGHI